MSDKSTYAIWLSVFFIFYFFLSFFFFRVTASGASLVVEVPYVLAVVLRAPKQPGGWAQLLCVLLSHFACEGKEDSFGPAVLWVANTHSWMSVWPTLLRVEGMMS